MALEVLRQFGSAFSVGAAPPATPAVGWVWIDTGSPVLTVTPSANQNDYAPTDLALRDVLRVNASASLKFTGLSATYDGHQLVIVNASTDYLLWLESENTASSAANRFLLPKGLPAFLMPGDSITVWYDGTSARWRVCDWPSQGQAMGLSWFTDFMEGNLGGLTSTVSGTGASAQAGTYLVGTTERPLGVAQIDTGTTATGRATLGHSSSGDIVPTLGAALSVCRVAAEAANSGTETWQLLCGFSDSAGGTVNDAVAWNLRWNGSAAEWAQDRVANATRTGSTTGSPTPDTNYICLAVFLNPAWSRADFLYSTDSVSWTKADSPTTGLPGNARTTGWVAASMIKSAGTTQRNASLDYAGVRMDQIRA